MKKYQKLKDKSQILYQYLKRNKNKVFVFSIAILLTLILIGSFALKPKNGVSSTEIISSAQNLEGFQLIIPKLGITVPVLENVDPTNPAEYNQKMTAGVAHMTGTSLPGQGSNIFIYGHSSANISSEFDKIFASLNELEDGDEILVNFDRKVYNYKVINKAIVEKNDLSVLVKTQEEIIQLMTCWPVGTTEKRLVVTAGII